MKFDSSLTTEHRAEIEQFLVDDISRRTGTEYIAYHDDDILNICNICLEEASQVVSDVLAGLIEENGGVNITSAT